MRVRGWGGAHCDLVAPAVDAAGLVAAPAAHLKAANRRRHGPILAGGACLCAGGPAN